MQHEMTSHSLGEKSFLGLVVWFFKKSNNSDLRKYLSYLNKICVRGKAD